jgi:iron complex transport system substrate-binding protein
MPPSPRLRTAVPLLVLAVAAAGCGFKPEPVGTLPSFPQTVQDGAGRSVTVTTQPVRIASLDAGLTESAYAVGAGADVVAATGKEAYPAAAAHLPSTVTRTGGPDMAVLRRARPDLVLVPASLGDRAAELSRALGAPVYVGGDGTVQAIEHDVGGIAVLTGNAAQGQHVVGRMQDRAAAVRRAVAGEPPVPVFVDQGFFYTIDPNGPLSALIRMAGGVDVATDAQPGRPYPVSRLRSEQPQAYLAVSGRGTTLAGLRESRATRSLPAVRDGRFTLIDERALTDSGPRVIATLRQIARALHPSLPLP